MPGVSELERVSLEYSDRLTEMTPEIHTELRSKIGGVLEDFLNSYEPINSDAEFEEVQHQQYPGFYPFTEGGFYTLILYPASEDTTHIPAVFDYYIQYLLETCRMDFYEEQTGEHPETEEILTAYFDALLDWETGDAGDKERYYNFEAEYLSQACPALEIKVLYYAADNIRNDLDHDSVTVHIATNTDAPYFREGRGLPVAVKHFDLNANTPTAVAEYLRQQLNNL